MKVDYEEEYQAWKPDKDYGSYDYKPWTPSTTTWSPDWAAHPEVSPLSGDFKVLWSDEHNCTIALRMFSGCLLLHQLGLVQTWRWKVSPGGH